MVIVKDWKNRSVGVDTNNLMPYSFDDLTGLIGTKDVLLEVDHHTKTTN